MKNLWFNRIGYNINTLSNKKPFMLKTGGIEK